MAKLRTLSNRRSPAHAVRAKTGRGLFAEGSDGKPAVCDSTLILLGNGPSLRDFNFERFKDFDCMGMNAAYRYWHQIGWYPRYYVCLDLVVGLSHKEAIIDLIRGSRENEIEFFFLRENLINVFPQDLRASPNIVDFDVLHRQRLRSWAAGLITTGSHAALVATELGYRRLALLGIDCNYVETVHGSRTVDGLVLEMAETPGDNPNYFFPAYQIAGDKYHQPNPAPDLHLRSWRAVAPFLKKHIVTVWNCSSISQVDAFPFRSFDEIESEQSARGERLRTLRWRPQYARTTDRHGFNYFRTRFGPLLLRIQQVIWRGRRKLGVLAVMATLLAAAFAATAMGYPYRWPLLTIGLGMSFFAVAVMVISLYRAARNAHEQAAIAFSKASLVAKELKSLEERNHKSP